MDVVRVQGIWLTLLIIVVPPLFALAAWGIVKLTAYLSARAEAVRSDLLRSVLVTATREGGILLGHIVRQLQTTVVNELKAKSEDGKLTRAEIEALKQTVRQKFQAELSEELYSALQRSIPDLEEWIQTQVDSHLYDLKLEASAVENMRKVEAIANPA